MNHFINTFKEKLEKVENKEFLVDNEINQIQKFISNDEPYQEIDFEVAFMKESNSVFNLNELGNPVFFNDIFNHYMMYGEYQSILGNVISDDEDVVLEDISNDESLMYIVKEAVCFADYYKWLKSFGKEKHKPKSNSSLTHKQKMLALHYLGLDLSKYDNTKSGNIIGEILGLDKGNSRKYLSYLSGGKNNVRTVNNLKAVLDLFDSQQLNEVSNIIKKDIELLTK